MATTDYSSAYSSTGFYGALLQGLQNLWSSPIYKAQPTKPNPGSQVMVARNSGFVVDPGAPATPYNPAGYAQADLWYDPINPTYASGPQVEWAWDNQRSKYVQRQVAPQQRAPHMYYVKSDYQPSGSVFEKTADSQLFKSPDAATLQQNPCAPPDPVVAATVQERVNRLSINQFLSPFRARRIGANSYQALSDPVDNIFNPTDGKPGDFSREQLPAFIQSSSGLRTTRG